MYSILHVSDLHRSKEEPVDNDSLLAALLADCDRYAGETPRIPPPHAIIVSGDIVQGACIDAQNWQQSMTDQYNAADSFLTVLCDRFLDGDRSRMVLVPGNHDICWNTSYLAMERVPDTEYPSNLYEVLVEPESAYRWSWSEQSLFRIVDMTVYKRRTGYYWDFVESFYNGVSLPVSIDRERGFQLFEFCDRRIVVSAFDSITGNDCFNFSGALPRGSVGQCAIALRDSEHSYDLKIAVWHHSIQGPPNRSDYMDASQVQEMIGHGFQLGLHGHQHIAGTQTQFVHLDQSRSMAIVGAGSLCAGTRELPRGVNRQYNLIVIDEDFMSARIHVREMAEGEQFTRKRNGAFSEGFVRVNWQPTTDIMGRPIDAQVENERCAIIKAEEALNDARPYDVVEVLKDVDISSAPHARKLMIEALRIQKNWPKLIAILQNQDNNIEEIVILVSAFVESNSLEDAQTILDAAEVDRATRGALQNEIEIKRMKRGL